MESFFFYDLETSGVNSRESRIMQFAGQRTDLNMKLIGEPINVLLRLSEDILPDPHAILITGITPQKTISEGITEAEFIKIFDQKINLPNTIFIGFNNIRFDDEFMRFLFYRNFYDAYEWQWKDGRSRWDLLDVSRMARALRPDGIKWPFNSDGKPSNRLELLASINNIEHKNAHDAMSDVFATINLAKLIKQNQSKLFGYLLGVRNKKAVEKIVESGQPFLYSSGKYSSDFEKTSIVAVICPHPEKNGVLVYDLRYDPKQYIHKSSSELAELWKWKKDGKEPRLPVKSLQFNRCPAIAPIAVLDEASKTRLGLDMSLVNKNLETIKKSSRFAESLQGAVKMLNQERKAQTGIDVASSEVDTKLYDKFIPDSDKKLFPELHSSRPEDLLNFGDRFSDERLKVLLPLYKARNFAGSLTSEELGQWERHRSTMLLSGREKSRMATHLAQLKQISEGKPLTGEKKYLVQELQLWAENLGPVRE